MIFSYTKAIQAFPYAEVFVRKYGLSGATELEGLKGFAYRMKSGT